MKLFFLFLFLSFHKAIFFHLAVYVNHRIMCVWWTDKIIFASCKVILPLRVVCFASLFRAVVREFCFRLVSWIVARNNLSLQITCFSPLSFVKTILDLPQVDRERARATTLLSTSRNGL